MLQSRPFSHKRKRLSDDAMGLNSSVCCIGLLRCCVLTQRHYIKMSAAANTPSPAATGQPAGAATATTATTSDSAAATPTGRGRGGMWFVWSLCVSARAVAFTEFSQFVCSLRCAAVSGRNWFLTSCSVLFCSAVLLLLLSARAQVAVGARIAVEAEDAADAAVAAVAITPLFLDFPARPQRQRQGMSVADAVRFASAHNRLI